jgi:DNA-binding NarL/FixJ family response regulator
MDQDDLPTAGPTVTVMGDDALALAGLEALLDREGLEVLPELGDVIVVDVGYGETGAFLEDVPAGDPVVAVASDVPSALAAWRSGVSGLLYRDVSSRELAGAVRAVASGLVVLQDRVAADLIPTLGPPPLESLTPREHDVLAHLALGLTNREIAHALGIRETTAKFHVNAVMGKLGATSRTEAVVAAARAGLVTF